MLSLRLAFERVGCFGVACLCGLTGVFGLFRI